MFYGVYFLIPVGLGPEIPISTSLGLC